MSAPNQNYIYLHKVDAGANNNKFYEMKSNGDGTFTVKYGREGAAKPATETYPMGKWESKYAEKVSSKKGYTDVTEFKAVIKEDKKVSVKNSAGQVISTDVEVVKLIQFLQGVSNNLTKANYEVEAKSVTQAQIDAAQKQIDLLFTQLKNFGEKAWNLDSFNKELAKLFIIIPRKMKRVADHMMSVSHKKDAINNILQEEQDLLDSMASQVTTQTAQDDTEDDTAADATQPTLLDTLGIEMSIVTDKAEIEKVKKNCQTHGHRVNRVFRVVNKMAQKRFDTALAKATNKYTRLLWHGSRTVNWMSILQNSLMIRPSGAAYSGSMFGDGIYGAWEDDKSWGYTDGGRWVNGRSTGKVYMALFEFHLGKQLELTSSDWGLNYQKVQAKGCDSTWGKKGPNLYRDEFIIYRPEQCTIKYLIEFNA